MGPPFDDNDPPTVTRHLSPRARTALASDDPTAPPGDLGDEPTVVVMQRPQTAPQDPQSSNASSLQNAARIVQQLDASPERTLVRAAAPLLLLVAQLRNSIEKADVSALRRQVVESVDRFQQIAQRAGVEAGDIIAARYVLCALIDETVLMTPWGSRSEWSSNSLLNEYHNETWGGEKVFEILDRVRQNPEQKLPLLLLIHTCLMLGFEGRYRVLERGRDQLEDLRNELSRTIRRYSKARMDDPLSRATKVETGGRRIGGYFPLWMAACIGLALLLFVYSYATFVLSGETYPLVSEIQSLTPGSSTGANQ